MGRELTNSSHFLHSPPIFETLPKNAALRWGRGRRLATPTGTIQWDFTANDAALGNGGLNCAAVNTNDSGGGIFSNDAVVGVIKGLLAQGFRYSLDEPVSIACELHPIGHVFDPSSFYQCSGTPHPLTRAYGAPVYPSLSNIFAHIAPPRRVNTGGPALDGEKPWEEGQCTGCSSFTDPSALLIDTTGLVDPAPQSVYKTAFYLQSHPDGAMTFVVNELVKYEKYKVRLHFASIFPATATGACLETVTVNGSSRVIDPYTGPAKATIVNFDDVSPDNNSHITVTIRPQNTNGAAMVSGVEVLMNPLVPVAQDSLKSDIVACFPANAPIEKVVYGNNVFVSGRSGLVMFSEDNGGTWQPAAGPLQSSAASLMFANGRFIGVAADEQQSALISSQNGRDWISHRSEPGVSLYGIVYGNGLLVATGQALEKQIIAVSSDLEKWTFVESPTTNFIYSLVFGNGRFVANDNQSSVLTSVDGTNWTRLEMQYPVIDPSCVTNCATWRYFGTLLGTENGFVTYAIASAKPISSHDTAKYSASLFTSPDAASWSRGPEMLVAPFSEGFFYANGDFIFFPTRTKSPDLINWERFELPEYPSEVGAFDSWRIRSIAFGNSNWVVTGILPRGARRGKTCFLHGVTRTFY